MNPSSPLFTPSVTLHQAKQLLEKAESFLETDEPGATFQVLNTVMRKLLEAQHELTTPMRQEYHRLAKNWEKP